MCFAFSPFRSWSRLAYLGEPLGSSWGSLGSLLEASWAPLGASWGPLGALLGRSWEPSGRSWGHLGGDLSKKGGSLIRVAPLECLESPLGPPKRPKSFQNLRNINVLCFLAFSLLEPSWAILDALTTRGTPRPGRWGGVRGGVNPSPKGKNGGWKRKRPRPPTP